MENHEFVDYQEPSKKHLPHKKLFAVSLALIFVSIVIIFFLLPSRGPSREYKIIVTHNNKPLDIINGIHYSSLSYGIILFNNNTQCNELVTEVSGLNQPVFSFSSDTNVNNSKLRDYANLGYSFSIYVEALPSGQARYWAAWLVPKDRYDSYLNAQELPKLTQNYSLTLDVPIFSNSTSSIFVRQTSKDVTVHSELFDNWEGNDQFLCVLNREKYDNENISSCPKLPVFLLEKNKECAQTYLSECGLTPSVIYILDAPRTGKNIECTIHGGDLKKGANYKVRIMSIKQLGENLYLPYSTATITSFIFQ